MARPGPMFRGVLSFDPRWRRGAPSMRLFPYDSPSDCSGGSRWTRLASSARWRAWRRSAWGGRLRCARPRPRGTPCARRPRRTRSPQPSRAFSSGSPCTRPGARASSSRGWTMPSVDACGSPGHAPSSRPPCWLCCGPTSRRRPRRSSSWSWSRRCGCAAATVGRRTLTGCARSSCDGFGMWLPTGTDVPRRPTTPRGTRRCALKPSGCEAEGGIASVRTRTERSSSVG